MSEEKSVAGPTADGSKRRRILTDEQRERYNANRRRARLPKRREVALKELKEAAGELARWDRDE